MFKLTPVQLAEIYFEGRRDIAVPQTLTAPSTTPGAAGKIYSLLADAWKKMSRPEDPGSLKSAETYMGTLGFGADKIQDIRTGLKRVMDYHIESLLFRVDPENPLPVLHYNDKFYLGIHFNSAPLSPAESQHLKTHFIHEIKEMRRQNPSLLTVQHAGETRDPKTVVIKLG